MYRHAQAHEYRIMQLNSRGVLLQQPLSRFSSSRPPASLLAGRWENGGCRATSFHAWRFLRRSDTVCHISAETATEQSILEIASTAQQHPREPAAAARPSSQASTSAAANADEGSRSAGPSFPARPRPAGQRRRGRGTRRVDTHCETSYVKAWLEGRAAAAGSRGCCWAVLAISRMLCSGRLAREIMLYTDLAGWPPPGQA